MSPQIDRDPRISNIFYYFEEHTTLESGRKMGRKIGVVQEILAKKLLLSSAALRDAIVYEQKVDGRSGASHKVEFMFFQPIGAVVLKLAESKSVPGVKKLMLRVLEIDATRRRARVEATMAQASFKLTMEEGQPCPIRLRQLLHVEKVQLKLSEVEDGRARFSALLTAPPVASVESKRVGAQRFRGSDTLGSGIQTIEKAKQASLVAIDYDLAFNKTFLPLSDRSKDRKYRSIVILGNGVHWTQNDRAVLDTYVDYTYLAKDEAIIRYADYVRAKADAARRPFKDFFISYFAGMTKTPPDDFAVTPADFSPVVPQNAPPLLTVVEKQLAPYETK